jgi:putative FmdB family regulatory protein
MPIYDLKCQKCGKISEFLVPNSADSRTLACPTCGGQNLERLISTPSLLKTRANAQGSTCCGREERCATPPCAAGEQCHRH